MNNQRKTTINQIADYWIENTDICEMELNIDWSDAYTHCWNCGDDMYRKSSKKVLLERAHIIPVSLGGQDVPSNYVLLCKSCHSAAPNCSDNNAMWDWIKSNYIGVSFYNTYKFRKALMIYKQKEGHSFFDKLATIKDPDKKFNKELEKCSTHGSVFNEYTYYYCLKAIIGNTD